MKNNDMCLALYQVQRTSEFITHSVIHPLMMASHWTVATSDLHHIDRDEVVKHRCHCAKGHNTERESNQQPTDCGTNSYNHCRHRPIDLHTSGGHSRLFLVNVLKMQL